MFCENCGKEINENAVTCIYCGSATSNLKTIDESNRKSWVVTLLLCMFLGLLGIHRFYINRPISGIVILLLSLSVVGVIITSIWVFVDFILILIRALNDGSGKKLQ